jgi:hypothetical protein
VIRPDPARSDGRLLTDDAGRPVARFLKRMIDGVALADLLEPVSDPDTAAAAVLAQLPGWRVAADAAFGRRLVSGGAVARRRSYAMTRDLAADPPPDGWATPDAPDGIRLMPAHRPAASLVPAFSAAFPADHPDFAAMAPPDDPERELAALLARGLLPCSGLAVQEDAVVGAILVNAQSGAPPLGGPWITDLFRDPAVPGTGTPLLRRALALGAADGLPALGLAVSHGNPAERLYAAHGFTAVLDALIAELPGTHEGPA